MSDLQSGTIELQHINPNIFPFEAFEFDDPHSNASPGLTLVDPWVLKTEVNIVANLTGDITGDVTGNLTASTITLASKDVGEALPPIGSIVMYGAATAPDGWVICDGSAVSRTTYAALFAVISTTFGIGDGSTTFNLPDMRGIFPRGAGNHGSLTMADSNPFSGGSVGATENDQMQGHYHNRYSGGQSNLIETTGGQQSTWDKWSAANNTIHLTNDLVRGAKTDGTNGTPRTGDETRPASISLNFIIRTGT